MFLLESNTEKPFQENFMKKGNFLLVLFYIIKRRDLIQTISIAIVLVKVITALQMSKKN